MVYKFLILLFLSSCASKYIKNDPKLDNLEDLSNNLVTPPQVLENTRGLQTEIISCYVQPEENNKKQKNDTKEKKIEKVEVVNVPIIPWSVGEKLHYEVHSLGMNAAQVEIEVLPMKLLSGEKVWHFTSQAKTKNFASTMYYFNSKAESYVNEQLKVKEHRSSAYEGDHSKIMIEKYNINDKKYFLYKKVDDKVEVNSSKEQAYLEPFVDLVFIFYYVRLAKVGDEISLLNNHKVKKIKVADSRLETMVVDDKKYLVDKLTLKYENKTHIVYRSKDLSKKVIKAVIDLKFASGTVLLKD
jgi:hypothetical protein